MRCSQPSRPESRLLALRDNSESLSPMCEKCWPHNLEDLEKARHERTSAKEQQKACLDAAAAELIREITQGRPLH